MLYVYSCYFIINFFFTLIMGQDSTYDEYMEKEESNIPQL